MQVTALIQNNTFKPKLSLAELLAKKTIKTDIVATVEEMNESITI